jgi:peptidoglycan/xylan/chitin deacetylase (PgdA/CDA1 family)
MKSALKRLAGGGLFAARLDTLLLRNRAVVVAFHRVQPTVDRDDGLTVDVRTFERHCRFFRRRFRVVPLRQIVRKLERGERLRRELAITFDDGYRDNYEWAAPVLQKLGLPATFFVVTDWMGTDIVPWWDAERSVRHAWMDWKQVRALHGRGFDLGAHTATHADLGQVSGMEAAHEIDGARRALESRLGAPVDLFAYPYGGPEHLTEANRRRVRGAGFRCCCSAYGGTVASGDDPFRLRRVPISLWHRSPQQFGLEVALGRSVIRARPRGPAGPREAGERAAQHR